MLLFCFILLACPTTAHAYIDPGTGSLIVQVIIGVTLSALFAIKIYWQKLKLFFYRRKSTNPETVIKEGSKVENS